MSWHGIPHRKTSMLCSNEYHYKASEISILNEWGTQVYSSRIETAYKHKINLSQFSAGIYYYVIHRANQKLQSGRFVKI
ncbi:MAG: gliding motility-associated C-terminal domain-containing protein [Saprospiraceae bacterium]|nr:gliding motility-associated C-terminal domain-containing protein [Saprospiraceae bacterium]